jgi:predicted metal-dependent hydrolase
MRYRAALRSGRFQLAQLVVRRLLVDLATPIPRRWCGGDAFRSAFFNALSMSFPVGEQFFIDAVREGAKVLPADRRAEMERELQGFIGQEATHRRIHQLFNGHLERQGLHDGWSPRALERIQRLDGVDARHAVGVTAATEHLTAIFADWLLANPQVLDGAEPRLATLWMWHASEESEHRATAFDLYRALGGDDLWRRRYMRVVSWNFTRDLARQTLSNLKRDGALWQVATWRSAMRWLFGRGGLVREAFVPWRSYFRDGFHPLQADGSSSQRWLTEHAASFALVDR